MATHSKSVVPLSLVVATLATFSQPAVAEPLEDLISEIGASLSHEARVNEGDRTAYRDLEIVFPDGSTLTSPAAWWVEGRDIFTATDVKFTPEATSPGSERGYFTAHELRGSFGGILQLSSGYDCTVAPYPAGNMIMSNVEIFSDMDALATGQSPETIKIQNLSLNVEDSGEACFFSGSVGISRLSGRTSQGVVTIRGVSIDFDAPNEGYEGQRASQFDFKMEALSLSSPNLERSIFDLDSLSLSGTFPSIAYVEGQEHLAINKIMEGPTRYTIDAQNMRLSIEGDVPEMIIDVIQDRSGSRRINGSFKSQASIRDGISNTISNIRVANIANFQSSFVMRVEPLSAAQFDFLSSDPASIQSGNIDDIPSIQILRGSLTWQDIALSRIMRDITGSTLPDYAATQMTSFEAILPDAMRSFSRSASTAVVDFLSRATESRMQVTMNPATPVDMITVGVLAATAPDQLVNILNLKTGEVR